ncbi:MAG TPA: TIGR03618 family F420-dependent PPOX class oxidoreductase [Candidatus Binatia bacterium]|nr:TIGR03618 family F420-dependent PPOX class oxidoreductase [Candidatus Binatia bacterium]
MNRRRQIALTPDEQREFLAAGRTIVLTSLDRRGYPHPVAMWYAVEPDGAVVMTTFAKSQKAVNLRRDPRCALLLEAGRTYDELKGLLIRGRAELDGDIEHVLDVLERVHARYGMPGEPGAALRAALAAQARKRVVIRVRPERVSSWDHRKLGGAY